MWPNPQKTEDLVTIIKEIINEKKKSLMENSIFCAVSLYCLKRIKKYFSVLEKRKYNVD